MKKIIFLLFLVSGSIASANTIIEESSFKLNFVIQTDCCESAEILQDYLTNVLGVSREVANRAQVLFYDECIQNQQN